MTREEAEKVLKENGYQIIKVPLPRLQWKRLTQTAKGPQKAHAEDAAWDLYADCPDGVTIEPGEVKLISCGLAIMPPEGWCCDLRGRSGMNSKGKFVILGLIDSYYTGPWGIVIHNANKNPIRIEHHDKVAQFTLQRVNRCELVEVEEFDVSGDKRGSGGFGSTGNK